MPDVLTQDIIDHSVTEADVMEYQGRGVINFVMPYFWATPRILSLPADLPPYWSFQRDTILRSTILYESFWASAVANHQSANLGKRHACVVQLPQTRE